MTQLEGYGQTATVSPIGGTVQGWSVGDTEVFYRFGGKMIGRKHTTRGGMHVCFPNYGTAPNKFAVPKHGGLRDTHGVEDNDTLGTRSTLIIAGHPELFGNHPMNNVVTIETELYEHGLYYGLTARVPEEGKSALVNPGFHPYFRTPQGTAKVHIGLGTRVINEPTIEPQFIKLSGTEEVRVSIPGLGEVRMRFVGAYLGNPEAQIVIWRDSADYLCVEPILGYPYGSEGCFKLAQGNPLEMGCTFSLTQ